jgi:hypothetical protein
VEWEESRGKGYLGGIDLGVALENVEDAVNKILVGEVPIVGGHRPCEPSRQGGWMGRCCSADHSEGR